MERNALGKRPNFYDAPVLDQMMSMIVVLAEEVSVLADHLDSIERVAEQHGIDLAGGIAALTLDEPTLQAREARRQAMLDRLFYLMRKEAAEAQRQESTESFLSTIEEIAAS